MSFTAGALLGLVTWSILLAFLLVAVRLTALARGRPFIEFDPSGRDLPGFGQRVTRAHANSIENLAIPASLLLYALVTNHTAITNGLACWVFYARVGQSIVHIYTRTLVTIILRAVFFATQMLICLFWIWKFWQAF